MTSGTAADSSHSSPPMSVNNSLTVPVSDYSDPLYLHPPDSSNIALISCVLTGCKNYGI